MSESTLTVLTLNCLFRPHARARLAALAPLLENSTADVLCLQEVVWRRNVALVRRLTPTFKAAAMMPNLGAGIRGGLLTLSRRSIEFQRFEVYRRRGRLRTIAFADWLLRKGFLTTHLSVDGQSIAVINTHLLANYDEDWSPGNDYARQLGDELKQLTSAILDMAQTMPVVVAGDLNVPADTALFEGFKEAAGLTDGFVGQHPPTAHPASRSLPDHTIDYVLVRVPRGRSCSITSRVVLDQEVVLGDGQRTRLSDHAAVQSVIRFEA